MPKVSIIVPNYNHAKYLSKRLDSIIHQTYQDFEVILLDDCSTDNSLEIINRYVWNTKIVHIVKNVKNSGGTFNQWVRGINLAKGEFIWIAESDDFAEERFLETAIHNFQDNNCSIFFSQSYIVDERGTVQGCWDEKAAIYDSNFVTEGKELIQKYMTFQNIIPNASAVVFSKGLLDADIEKDILNYKINGDWYLWINLLMKGNCAYHSKPLNYFRRHEAAGSNKNVTNFKNIEEAFKINIFLKNNNFKINGQRWLRIWIGQTGYRIRTLLERNFLNIYKLSFELFPFPFTYMLYIIFYHKIKKLYSYFKLL